MARPLGKGRLHSPWRKLILCPLWALQLTLLSTSVVLISLCFTIYAKGEPYIPKWMIINLIVGALNLLAAGVEIIVFMNRGLRPNYLLYSSIIKMVLATLPLVLNILALVLRGHDWGKWLYAIIGLGINIALYITFILQTLYSVKIYRQSAQTMRKLVADYASAKALPSIITTMHDAEMQPLNHEPVTTLLPEVRIIEASPISTPQTSVHYHHHQQQQQQPGRTSSQRSNPMRWASISSRTSLRGSGDVETESLYDDGRSWVEGDDGRIEEKIVDSEVEAATYQSLIGDESDLGRGWSMRSQQSRDVGERLY